MIRTTSTADASVLSEQRNRLRLDAGTASSRTGGLAHNLDLENRGLADSPNAGRVAPVVLPSAPMAAPHIGFCPYLSTNSVVSFADWELGPLSAFTARWQDRALQEKAEHFLSTFTDAHGGEIKNPSLLCRQGQQIDGTLPQDTEIEALQQLSDSQSST